MKSTFRHLVMAAAISVGLTACATPRTYNHIDQPARLAMDSAETLLIVVQSEIGSDIDVSDVTTATGGGLLPALIDAGINANRREKAEEMIAPIRDMLVDYDFASVMKTSLAESLESVSVEGMSNVTLSRSTDMDMVESFVQDTATSAVLLVNTDYKLSSDFSRMIASANVFIYPKDEALFAYREKGDKDAKLAEYNDNIYRNSILFEANLLPAATADKPTNAAAVAALDAEEIQAVLDKAAKGLANAIASDLLINDMEPEELG